MDIVVEVQWDDAILLAAEKRAYVSSVVEATAVARARAPWAHVRASIEPSPEGIVVGSSDAALAEGGSPPHVIEPSRQVVRYADGDFATGPISHPGFRGTPYMREAAAAWPSLFDRAAMASFPKG